MSPKRAKQPAVTFSQDRTLDLPTRTMRALQRDGYDAGWRGKPVTDCPYRFDPKNPDREFDQDSASAWLAGHAAAITDARIHRRSTPEDVRDQHGTPGLF